MSVVTALLLLACSPPPPAPADPQMLAGGVPAGWVWVTDTSGPFEAAFPARPSRWDQTEGPKGADGTPIHSVRWEAFVGKAAFVVYRTREPPGVVAAGGGPAAFARRVARDFTQKRGAELADTRSWDALEGGWASRFRVAGAEGELRIGLDGDALYVIEAVGAPSDAAAATFLDAVRPIEHVAPVRVALPAGRQVECPARCGPFEEPLAVSGRVVRLTGVSGQLDSHRFEALAVPLGDLDRDAVLAALRARVLPRGEAPVREGPAGGGVEFGFALRNAEGTARIVELDGAVVAVQVVAQRGSTPEWRERFFGSIR